MQRAHQTTKQLLSDPSHLLGASLTRNAFTSLRHGRCRQFWSSPDGPKTKKDVESSLLVPDNRTISREHTEGRDGDVFVPEPLYSWTRTLESTSTQQRNHKTPKLSKLGFWKVALVGLSACVIVKYFVEPSFTPKPVFDTPRFTTFTIIAREEVSPTSIILTLQPKTTKFSQQLVLGTKITPSDPYIKSWERGTWSVEFKQPELQISRSYTPLPPEEHNYTGNLRFLIRKEHKGEVSGYLHKLPIGAEVELRGPNPEIDLPEDITDVVFLAGGTGIAPALQVVHTLLETRNMGSKSPRIHIIWANRRREDCEGGISSSTSPTPRFWKPVSSTTTSKKPPGYLVRELQDLELKHAGHVKVDYLVDEEGTFLDQKKISQAAKANSEVKLDPMTKRIGSKLLFVSGPDGFVSYFAGPKKWEGGKESQGQLGGVIGRMRLSNWRIFKL